MSRTQRSGSPVAATSSSIGLTYAGAPPCSGPGERADGRRERRAAVGAGRGDDARGERRGVQPVLGGADPVGVDRLHVPRVGLAAPAEQELLGGGRPAARRPRPEPRRSWPSATRAERATIAIICAESRPRSSRACSSEISFSLPSFQTPASRAVSAWRSAGAFPVSAAGSYGSGSGMAESRSLSTSRPQTRSYGYVPDELLDVDAAVAERRRRRGRARRSPSRRRRRPRGPA